MRQITWPWTRSSSSSSSRNDPEAEAEAEAHDLCPPTHTPSWQCLAVSLTLSLALVCVQMPASLTFNWFLHCYGPLSLLIHVQVGRQTLPPSCLPPPPLWPSASFLLAVCDVIVIWVTTTTPRSGARNKPEKNPLKLCGSIKTNTERDICRYIQLYKLIYSYISCQQLDRSMCYIKRYGLQLQPN